MPATDILPPKVKFDGVNTRPVVDADATAAYHFSLRCPVPPTVWWSNLNDFTKRRNKAISQCITRVKEAHSLIWIRTGGSHQLTSPDSAQIYSFSGLMIGGSLQSTTLLARYLLPHVKKPVVRWMHLSAPVPTLSALRVCIYIDSP